jgi:hypothetical protein
MMFWKMSIDLSRPLVPSMGHETPAKKALQRELLAAALEGLSHYVQERKLERPASQRLAFRELGLAIGLSAVELMASSVDASRGHDNHLRTLLEPLRLRGELAAQIRSFWLDPEHRRSATWSEHEDINEVMLATSLTPEGYLVLPLASLTKKALEMAS